MNMLKTFAAAALLATVGAASATAQEFTFNYEPWHLSSAEGRTQTLDRLERQVRNYCGVTEARGALQRHIAQDCRDRTMQQALNRIGDPRILAMHQQRELRRQA